MLAMQQGERTKERSSCTGIVTGAMKEQNFTVRRKYVVACILCVSFVPLSCIEFMVLRPRRSQEYIQHRGGYVDYRDPMTWENASPFRSYVEVNWSNRDVTDDEVHHICRLCPTDSVNVAGNIQITDEGVKTLSSLPSSLYSRIDELSVQNTSATKSGIGFFQAAHPTCRVYHSCVGAGSPAQANAATVLRKCKARIITNAAWEPIEVNLVRLKTVTDDTVSHLVCFHTIKVLILQGTNVTDDGVDRLADLLLLECLTLADTEVTDACLDVLARMDNLRFLDIHGTKVHEAGAKALKARIPNCRILW
jgi:hypothetical protein